MPIPAALSRLLPSRLTRLSGDRLEKSIVSAIKKGNIPRLESLLDEYEWDVSRPLKAYAPLIYGRRVGNFMLLHLAALMSRVEIAHVLIKRGADVDARCKNMMTPAMYAAQKGDKVMVAFLASCGADLDLTLPSTSTYLVDDGWVGDSVVKHLNRHFCASQSYSGKEYDEYVASSLENGFKDMVSALPSSSRPRM